jgi:cell division initiation protein
MPMQPIDIQKARFSQKLRGYDSTEVENFLSLIAEELAQKLAEIERLDRDNRALRERMATAEDRERQLHETILRGKKVSDEMIQTSQREAQLLIKEAEINAEKMIMQAAERAADIENRIHELRMRRKEMQLKLKGTVELFQQILEADMEEERSNATVHTLQRSRKSGA